MNEKPFALSSSSKGRDEVPLAASPHAERTAVAPLPPSDTEPAHRCFAEEVGRLSGVLRVEQWGEDGSATPTFHVYLRPEDRDTKYEVYELKGRVYDRFP